jgi:dTDP-glucose pyrophosphorylase
LREVGVTDIGVILGNLGREAIQQFLGDGSRFGVDITYIVQGEPLGLAHAVGCAREFVGDDDFVVYLGDNVLKQGIGELVSSFRRGEFAAGIALQRVDDPRQFGVADVDSEGRVVELVEKPDVPPSDLALIGIYVFSPVVSDVIEGLSPLLARGTRDHRRRPGAAGRGPCDRRPRGRRLVEGHRQARGRPRGQPAGSRGRRGPACGGPSRTART